MNIKELQKEIKSISNSRKAQILQKFFKTKKGEYGEGDIFLGVTVPQTRSIAKKYSKEITLSDAEKLLESKIHEERLCALLILVHLYEEKKASAETKKEIYEFYLKNTKHINNWDLVDLSSHHIIGDYVFNHPKEIPILEKLAKSKLIWDKRIAMVSCYHFIHHKNFDEPLKIAEILLNDSHDLIQKAVGWMLREIGKCDSSVLEEFLKKKYKKMPRTMLRYAIEKFPEKKRKKYLRGLI